MRIVKLNAGLIKLVSILNDGEYHDGTNIGYALNMTRSAVWKLIKKLEGYGIKIDCVKGKGYALQEPLILLNRTHIRKGLLNKKIEIDIIENITSTNDYLKNYFHDNKPRICIAEQQSSGKGRLHREWYSPFAQNIYLSCLYPFERDISEVSGLSMVVSLAIIATCSIYHLPKPILVKWPNDVISEDKKLAGNLIELQAESHGSCTAIIGIGVNVNMLFKDADKYISQPWTSLREITDKYIDRNVIIIKLLNTLFNYLERFNKQGLAPFIDEWTSVDGLRGKKIILQGIADKVSGVVQGIDELGHILIKQHGKCFAYSSGDTQIIKQ